MERLLFSHFDIIRNIEMTSLSLPQAVEALTSLAHDTRLAVFRLLVRAGAEGASAGDIARAVGVLPNTLSTHLTILARAKLVQSRRDGRSIVYSADYAGMSALLQFLVADCCAGRPEICGTLGDFAQICGDLP